MTDWNDINNNTPEKSGSYLITVRHFEQGAGNPAWNGEHLYVETAVYDKSNNSWTFKGYYDDEMLTFTNGQLKEESEDHDWYYLLQITAWAVFPEVYRKPITNREAFFAYMRSELEKDVKIWEAMSEDEFMDWASREKAHIEFLVGRELCGFKLDRTHSISVGTKEDMRKWLKEVPE